MLQFLVLGQVPGTHLQINFNDVVLIFAGTLVFYQLLRFARQLDHKITSSSLQISDDTTK